MANWTLCNLYAGCQGIDWAQTDVNNAPLSNHHKNRFSNLYAFTLEDVECLTLTNQCINIQQAISAPENVGSIKLRFEEQKNGENGEKKSFVCNQNKLHLCFVAIFMQILGRHNKLSGNPKQPLSIYQTKEGKALNITTANIEVSIRSAASKLYNLDPVANKKELQMWASNLLRVGACTTLYAMGFHEMEIKHLLQWKSDAFMTYLCNLAVTSRRHNTAIEDASAIPNFL